MSIAVSIRKRLSKNFTLQADFTNSGSLAFACLGILGASGCGKSMTLKCIAGIETPDEGHISVNGRVLFDSAKRINLRPQARRVGCLFQNYALFPRMTVLENISAAMPPPAGERRRKSLEWIERLGLGGLENRFPRQLSGGQQQRTALARMLIREPEAILLDEPFSALDASLREQMQMRLLALLASRGDVILVTHDRDEAYRLCGGILIMDQGVILAAGPVKEIFADPGTVRAARLTGCKNISAAVKTGERELLALDWGLRLRTAAAVAPYISHVGIRAHNLRPASGEAYNLVRPRVKRRTGEPFEELVLFTNAEAETGEGRGEIWWKFSKYAETAKNLPEIPECLFLPPEALLLLREQGPG
ncbi:MAG: ATP-binding cassette domain-containing protein [Treponema sp.]|jgi:molybdate transport system ATP-binding protein|nr:ATP-binding cassette domain-containing protein [Treponema sp.]